MSLKFRVVFDVDLLSLSFFSFGSGYANRIHELLDVSRELSGLRDRLSSQNSSVGNYISEANYIEFSGVKVIIYHTHFNFIYSVWIFLETICYRW